MRHFIWFVFSLWNVGCVCTTAHLSWVQAHFGAHWAHVASMVLAQGQGGLLQLQTSSAIYKNQQEVAGRNHSLLEGYSQCCGYFCFHSQLYSTRRACQSCCDFLSQSTNGAFLSLTHSTKHQRINKTHQSCICHPDWGRRGPRFACNGCLALLQETLTVCLQMVLLLYLPLFNFSPAKVRNNSSVQSSETQLEGKCVWLFIGRGDWQIWPSFIISEKGGKIFAFRESYTTHLVWRGWLRLTWTLLGIPEEN